MVSRKNFLNIQVGNHHLVEMQCKITDNDNKREVF